MLEYGDILTCPYCTYTGELGHGFRVNAVPPYNLEGGYAKKSISKKKMDIAMLRGEDPHHIPLATCMDCGKQFSLFPIAPLADQI